MSKRSIIPGLCIAMLLCSPCSAAVAEGTKPSPDLSPTEVVVAQLAALRDDDHTRGARQAYRFASPSNRRAIGSGRDFAAVLERGYADMFSQARARVRLLHTRANEARVLAELEQPGGRESAYVFFLSRQSAGDCEGCWMTDGVYPLQPTNDAPLHSI